MADIFSIVGSSLAAENARMAGIASNLANIDSIAAPGAQPYRAEETVFQAADVGPDDTGSNVDDGDTTAPDLGVSVVGEVQSNAPSVQKYDPTSPYANADGYVTGSNVNQADEMVNLIDSSNTYSASVAVLQQASKIDQQLISSFQVA
jgi:flagellar basal-body rod protein FlgC